MIFDLQPLLVMAHFVLSIVLLTNAIVLYRRAGEPDTSSRSVVSSEVRAAGRLLLVVTAAVIVAGTFVTATGPHLGDKDVKPLSFNPPEVARIHGSLVIALLVLIGVTFVLLRRQSAPIRRLRAGSPVPDGQSRALRDAGREPLALPLPVA